MNPEDYHVDPPDGTLAICEALVRQVEISGAELFERNFVQSDRIICSVLVVVGTEAEELVAMVREWAHGKGMIRAVDQPGEGRPQHPPLLGESGEVSGS